MGRIFLSHASEEHELVIHLANHLEKNNLRAWYAPRDIMGGIDYDKEIIAAIKDCRAFVLLLSRNSDASEDVKTEVYHAVKYHKQVICLDVDDVEPENLSYLLGMRHRLNWLERRDETLDKLAHDIKRIPDSDSDSDSEGTRKPVNEPESAIKAESIKAESVVETLKPAIQTPKTAGQSEPITEAPKPEPAKNFWGNYRWAVIAIIILCTIGIIPVLISKPGYIEPVNYDVVSLARDGKLEELRKAINASADVNAKDNEGWTALIRAVWKGHKEVAEFLINHGADVNAKYNIGRTALVEAAWYGYTEIAEFLINHGADVNAKDNSNWTALMLAAWNGHTETAEILLKHGADINAKNNDGWTALMLAAWNGHTETAEILLKHGADINAKNNDGWTVLMLAAWNGHTETAEILLKHGADINARNNFGWTALMEATLNGHTETAELFLKHGADINARNNFGWTALMEATLNGHTETAELLLKNDADKNIRNKEGKSAYDLAVKNGNFNASLLKRLKPDR